MHRCDVLIVGGGPAGSSLAWRLRERDLAVTILDRKTFPRDKVCAGWVTPEVVRSLRIDLAAYARERTLQPIRGFRVSLLGRPQVEWRYGGEPVSYGIRRYEFDHFLLERSGAALRLGAAFQSMTRDGDGWIVNGDIRARLVVGAGGHFCPVARAIGARPEAGEQIVAAQEIEFRMTPAQRDACVIDPEVPELFFTPDLTGYGWIFRKGDYLNIGLGREDNQRLSEHVQAFWEYLQGQGKLPPGSPMKLKGHAYLLYHHALRDVLRDGVLLIGDAAGLAYPESGEGIRPAVESGLLAGQVIEAAAGDFGQARLAPYYDLLTQRLGRRRPSPGLLERVPLGLRRALAGRLMQTRWFVRKVLIERWFLHRHLAPLSVDGPPSVSP
ncbi:MAG: NAD(P)/FAD-dependent oxidoreductase [Candidatus Lambdaproteobacteria bacterium]|nr:NAD(P)/FAD-dependent oxidoreductase [Candidatus Lambdaproteobacteria bacterium]